MTKPNFTSINVLIDASGSMGSLANDTIGGFNQFLRDQKQVLGEAIFSLCLFNTRPNPIHDCVPLAQVPELNDTTYHPSGGTALLEAVGITINNLGNRLSAMAEEERPSKVIFLIITDGEENSSSKEFSLDKIKEMVSHQRDVYSWEFVFMGANIDAFAAGSGVGVVRANSMNYVASAAGTRHLYATVSNSLRTYRTNGGGSKVDFFNQDDQQPLVVTPAVPANVVINPDPIAPVISPPPGTPVAFNPPIDFTRK